MERPGQGLTVRALTAGLALLALCITPAAAQQSLGGGIAQQLPPSGKAPSEKPADQPQSNQPPVLSNSVQITSRPPDPEKWVSKTDPKTGTRVFICKPLACPDAASVKLVNKRSPTRNPDPKALERFAKVDFPKSLQSNNASVDGLGQENGNRRSVETLAAATATLKGYPGVSNESKITAGDKVVYLNVAIIFAGPAMIEMSALSPDREFSQKILAQFVDLLIIKDAPPSAVPAPAPSPQPGAPSIKQQPKQQAI